MNTGRAMVGALLCVAVGSPVVARCLAAAEPAQSPQSVAIVNATVIDASSPQPRRGQTIVVNGDRIVAAGPSATVRIPAGARTLDAENRFVIPGLWDMHAHTDVPGGRGMLAAYVYNGVTGVRDMAGDWETLTRWRRDIAAGALIGPRILASGPYLEGNPQPIPHIPVKSIEDARRAVDSLKRLGVDVIKFHTGLTRETFFAAAARAREVGVPFAGHVPRSISAIEASDSGMRSIEHLLTIPVPCTVAESIGLAPRYPVQRVLGPCTTQPLDAIIAALVRNGTWVTPTHVAVFEVAEWPLRAVPGDAYARYLPDTLRRFVEMIFPMPDSIPADAYVAGRAMFAKRLGLAGTLHRAGVRLLAGTDPPLRNSPPGFGLAAELELLAQGGLTPFDVLKVATWEPANYFSILERSGTVTAGRFADLVILDRDPLADVSSYRSVWAVVAGGRLYDSDARRRMLTEMEATARR